MDLIDRQAVLSIIRMAMPEETSGSLLYQSVKQLPTIDAEPVRHGRWKFEYSLNMNYCSDCGWGMVKGERRKYNYCPNCGAKMEVNEE